EPEHDALLVGHHRRVEALRLGPIAHSLDGLIQPARGDVLPGNVANPRLACQSALRGQPRRQPVLLPGLVVVYLSEAKALEPPRGPWAHVSGGVPAVDDHGAGGVEQGGRLLDAPKRDVDRAGQVLVLVLLRRQDLHELSALTDEPLHILPPDGPWHDRSFPSTGRESHASNTKRDSRPWTAVPPA